MLSISKKFRTVALSHDFITVQITKTLYEQLKDSAYARYMHDPFEAKFSDMYGCSVYQFNVARDDLPDFLYGITD